MGAKNEDKQNREKNLNDADKKGDFDYPTASPIFISTPPLTKK